MRSTGFVFDRAYLLHETGAFHPEVPERIEAVYDGIERAGLIPRLTLIPAQRAEFGQIEWVHDRRYIRRFEEASLSGRATLDSADNRMCPDTFETALLAVGGVLKGVDMVMSGAVENAFCAVRPPGHHAERDRAMGFCYFNNVAVAAVHLRKNWGIGRVGIVDIDVHHGNGTQQAFERDPSVFYYSIHQHPSFAYPGTGREFEKGSGPGYGFTLNSPVLPGGGDAEYRKLLERDLFPAFESFKPEVILLSTGFDAHADDEMSDILLSTEGYSWIMDRLIETAERHAGGRLISVLEGGYSLERLPELAAKHLESLIGSPGKK
jgi:acetoin utilization deacetylase AcuC-like enzyme